jgi:hypothetical protein
MIKTLKLEVEDKEMILIKIKELINKQMLKIKEIEIKLLLIKMPNKMLMPILVRVVKDKMMKDKKMI